MLTLEEEVELKLPPKIGDFSSISSGEFNFGENFTNILVQSTETEGGKLNVPDPEYEQFLADVWVGIVLTLMVLSCVCFMCSCLIYHKFQQWKTRVIESRNAGNIETGLPESELPSYTIASGLPTYEEALQQLHRVKDPPLPAKPVDVADWTPQTPPTPVTPASMNVVKFFQGCTNDNADSAKAT